MSDIMVKDQAVVDVYHKYKHLEKLIYLFANEPSKEPILHRMMRETWDAVKAHAETQTGENGGAV